MEAKKKRFGKTTLRVMAGAAGVAAFALPWAAFQATPAASASASGQSGPQVVVVPAGSKVVVLGSPSGATGVKVIRSKATTTTTATAQAAPVTTTGASAPPP